MVAAAKQTGRVVQIGSQRVSSVNLRQSQELLANGIIALSLSSKARTAAHDPTGAWEYRATGSLSRQLRLETLGRRRHSGRGSDTFSQVLRALALLERIRHGPPLAGDLLVHLVSGMNFMLAGTSRPSAPWLSVVFSVSRTAATVPTSTPRSRLRTMPIYMRLNLGCDTPGLPASRAQGNPGSHGIQHQLLPQSGEDESPSYYTSGYPQAMREAYLKKWHEEHDPKPGKEPIREGFSYRGASWDEEKPTSGDFFQGVRNHQQVTEDTVFGHNAALCCTWPTNPIPQRRCGRTTVSSVTADEFARPGKISRRWGFFLVPGSAAIAESLPDGFLAGLGSCSSCHFLR